MNLIRKALISGAIGLGAAAWALLAARIPFVETIELKSYDWRVRQTARPSAPDDRIVLVEINDDTLHRMEPIVGRWPWPRLIHSTVIDYLAAGGAKVIVYDILFAESDRRKFTVGESEWTGEESDRALVESTAKAGSVVHIAEAASPELVDSSRAVVPDLSGIPAFNQPLRADPCAEPRPVITPPFPALAAAARGIGHNFFVYDADGPLRQTSPFVRVGDRAIPSLALAATMIAEGVNPSHVQQSRDSLTVGPHSVPLIAQRIVEYDQPAFDACRALVKWRGPALNDGGFQTFTSFSFYRLFYSQQQILEDKKPELDPNTFRDRIVILGATAQNLYDVFTTPFSQGKMSGPEVHANIIHSFMRGEGIVKLEWPSAAAITLGAALGIGLLGAIAGVWTLAAVAAVLAGVIVWASLTAFRAGVWMPLVTPLVAIGLTFVGELSWQYFVEGREKRQVKRLFSRYVPKDVYEQLIADPTRAALGGKRRMMTVLFSDVRGFTSMSEKATPEEVVGQLNEYFSRMVRVLFEHHGTLDKFVGDMVMGLFGAPLDDPDHADHAVQAALAMTVALNELNQEWAAAGRPQLDIGIGISTGDMVAGNIGSDTIMSYTVIGDTVNLGARLESLNKEYGTRLIISDATREALKGRYDIRPLGEVTVKGKSRPVAIFEVRAL